MSPATMAPPGTIALQRNLAAALRAGRLDESRLLLERLRELDPAARETGGFELELRVREKRFDDALELAETLLALFPDSARLHLWAGRAASALRRHDDALARFEQSFRLAPRPETERQIGHALACLNRFDEAEAILERLAPNDPFSRLPLAWVHERRGRLDLARREIEAYCRVRPDDPSARQRLARLRAAEASPESVVHEVEALDELGEAIPGEMLKPFIEGLLRTGRGAEARERVRTLLPSLEPKQAVDLAYAARRLQAWDLAVDLFLAALPSRSDDPKILNSLEHDARLAGRTADLARAYRALAPNDRRFFGRARKLEPPGS